MRVSSARSSAETMPSASALRRTHSSSGVQYASPSSTTGKCITLPVWISVSDSNSSSAVPKPAGEDAEALGRLHEHRLAGVEVVEDQPEVDVVVHPLLVRQLDPEADREPAALAAAAVRRLHHARPAAGDDRPARLGEEARRLAGELVGPRLLAAPAPSRSTRPPGRSIFSTRSKPVRNSSPISFEAPRRYSSAVVGLEKLAILHQNVPLCRVASTHATRPAARST